jgi:hypothetical protein
VTEEFKQFKNFFGLSHDSTVRGVRFLTAGLPNMQFIWDIMAYRLVNDTGISKGRSAFETSVTFFYNGRGVTSQITGTSTLQPSE